MADNIAKVDNETNASDKHNITSQKQFEIIKFPEINLENILEGGHDRFDRVFHAIKTFI